MKTLLRSTFQVKPTESLDFALQNYNLVRSSGLSFDNPEDVAIWNYVIDFVRDHQHVPNIGTLRTHFDRIQEHTVSDRLEMLSLDRPKVQGDFRVHLNSLVEDKRLRRMNQILADARSILTTGIQIKDGKKTRVMKGPVDSVRYILDNSQEVVAPITGERLSGDIPNDGQDFWDEYERVEADPLAGMGQFCGIEQIDTAIRGAKKQELWLHAAFTGGMKSTFALNWAYNQAVYYKFSTCFFSLEMPYKQCRRILYAMHSGHEKFDKFRPKGKGDEVTVQRIQFGELSKKARKFMKDYVVPDFNDPENKYGSIHIEVADPDKEAIKVADIRSRAETLFAKKPFHMVFVDHALLIAPRKWVASTTERLNEVLRDCKRMAMNFNRGEGMAVVCLFQISREGYKMAMKRGDKDPEKRGEYDLTNLSYANEAERSSDIVTATWIDDDLKKESLVKFQCMKTRDHAPFDRFIASVDWNVRRIKTLDASEQGLNIEDVAQSIDDQISAVLG